MSTPSTPAPCSTETAGHSAPNDRMRLLPGKRTRLVVGGYQSIRPRWLERLLNFWVYPPVHWIMQTRQFANLERNIEEPSEDGSL